MLYYRRKKGCRHCRFERCLRAGMDAAVVRTLKWAGKSDDTLLSVVLSCRNRAYVTRGLRLREIDTKAGRNGKLSLARSCSGRTFKELCHVEYPVLTDFLSDYNQRFKCFKEGVSAQTITGHFFAIWIMFEQLFAAVSYGNLEQRLCLTDYGTTLTMSHDWLAGWYRAPDMQWVGDPDALARYTLENCLEALRLARTIRRATLDDVEVTALIQLLMAYYERELFVDQSTLRNLVNKVFRELHLHYESTYFNYAERLSMLTEILGQFHVNVRLSEQFYTLVRLCAVDDSYQAKTPEELAMLDFPTHRRSVLFKS